MNKKAFTFIELLVAVAIASILFLATSMVIVSGHRIYSGVLGSIDLRQHVRNGMDRIVREVRESNGSKVTLDQINQGSSEISFTGPRYKNQQGVLCPVRYYLSDRKIIREYPPNTLTVVAIDIDRLSFIKDEGAPVVQISIESSKDVQGKLLTFVLTQKVRLRNE